MDRRSGAARSEDPDAAHLLHVRRDADLLGRRPHMALEEAHHSRPGISAVLGFRKTVALVLVTEIVDLAAARSQSRDDLLCFFDRHARVVRAMDDHERRLDAVDEIER
jgi:hypothetical protein